MLVMYQVVVVPFHVCMSKAVVPLINMYYALHVSTDDQAPFLAYQNVIVRYCWADSQLPS